MASAKLGFNTAWGIGTEADNAYGTAVAMQGWIPFSSESIAKEREVIEWNTSQARFQMEMTGDTKKNLGRVSVGGDVSFPVEPVNFGYVLKHGLGAAGTPTTVTTGVYEHTFKPGGTLASFTSQIRLADSGTVKAKRVKGAMVDSLSLDFAEDLLTASASIKAKDMDTVTGSGATANDVNTPTYPTQRPYAFTDAAFTVGAASATAHIASGSLQISNSLIDDHYRQGSASLEGLYAGVFSIEGSFDLTYDPTLTNTSDLYDWIEDEVANNVVATYTGNNVATGHPYTLTVKVPRAIVTSSSPQVSAGEKIMRTVNFRSFYDAAQADPDKSLSIKLKNARSSAY